MTRLIINRKHLAEDIQPYTCISASCPNPDVLYVTRQAWESHLREDHGSADVWMCFACLERTEFENEGDFVAHTLQEHHDTISKDQVHALTSACKRPNTATITSCPLCNWPSAEDGEISREALLDHIAEHVHAFSLRALPWAPNIEHETETQVQRATRKVELWLIKYDLSSETSEILPRSESVRSSLSPLPEYFDTHDYFAEESDSSIGTAVSNGTIAQENRNGPPLSLSSATGEGTQPLATIAHTPPPQFPPLSPQTNRTGSPPRISLPRLPTPLSLQTTRSVSPSLGAPRNQPLSKPMTPFYLSLPTQVKVRVNFENGNYLTCVIADNITYQALVDRIDAKSARFTNNSIGKGDLKLRYRDEDGDFVTIECDDDIEAAMPEWWREFSKGIYEVGLFCIGDVD